jgi:hypothetical protein
MTNSFYYFFSAAPQVLAAILALFGVFVIFKIQNIKTELLGIGELLSQRVNYLYNTFVINKKEIDAKSFAKMMVNLQKGTKKKDINGIRMILDEMEYEIITKDDEMIIHIEIYKDMYSFLQYIIWETVLHTKVAAIVIIICLAIIPFGSLIIDQPLILYPLFSGILISIIKIFYHIVSILKKSLEEIPKKHSVERPD